MAPSDGAPARAAVIVTCHNDGATLERTLDSIVGQAGLTQLVVVDDGSSDHATLRTLERIERGLPLVIRQPNQGQAAATMSGLRATDAPYVMRFDADDVLLPGAIAALSAALDAHQDASAAWGDIETSGITNFRIPPAPVLDRWLVTYVNCIPGSGTLYRRSAVMQAGGWQLETGFEDWDLWMALAELGYSGVYVNRPVFRYYRDGQGQLTSWLPRTEHYYEELRHRHPQLFEARPSSVRRSSAPTALKVAVVMVDRLTWLPRLRRIQLSEMLTHLFWNGGIIPTSRMLFQALLIRARSR